MSTDDTQAMADRISLEIIKDHMSAFEKADLVEFVIANAKTLHPFALAIATLKFDLGYSQSEISDIRAAGLETCWFLAVTDFSAGLSEFSAKEHVEHGLTIKYQEKSISVGFRSDGEIYWCTERANKFYGVRALNVPSVTWSNPSVSGADICTAWLQHTDSVPLAYPEDSGEQIGGITCRLAHIGGFQVAGPTYENDGVESRWSDLSEAFQSRDIEQSDDEDGYGTSEGDGSICLLHYLTREQAQSIGIDTIGEESAKSSKRRRKLPNWLSETVDFKSFWISESVIIQSYANGSVIPSSILFSVAPNKYWDPTERDEYWNISDPDERSEPSDNDGEAVYSAVIANDDGELSGDIKRVLSILHGLSNVEIG